MYAVTYVEKCVSEDSYENEASVESRCVLSDKTNIVGDTLADVLSEFRNMYGIPEADTAYLCMLNGPGYVSFNRTENDNGDSPSDAELGDFKAGKRNLWLADWTMRIERREVSPVTVEELESLTGVTVES